jgi:CheY-like chemotaxis protein
MAETARLDLHDRRCLIADHDWRSGDFLSNCLSSRGAVAKVVVDGAQAMLEMKRAHTAGKPYEIVLLDAQMSPIDGYEVAAHLRKSGSPELGRLVLLLPADHRLVHNARAESAGVLHHLTRPVTCESLLVVVAEILGMAPPVVEPADVPARTVRVLVVDDNEDTRRLIGYSLVAPEFAVEFAENGARALDLFQAEEYDVVLMDLMMPVMDGYMAMQALRQWEKENRRARALIIAMTAHVQTEDGRKSLRAGCDQYLAKPFTRDALAKAVRGASRTRHRG